MWCREQNKSSWSRVSNVSTVWDTNITVGWLEKYGVQNYECGKSFMVLVCSRVVYRLLLGLPCDPSRWFPASKAKADFVSDVSRYPFHSFFSALRMLYVVLFLCRWVVSECVCVCFFFQALWISKGFSQSGDWSLFQHNNVETKQMSLTARSTWAVTL